MLSMPLPNRKQSYPRWNGMSSCLLTAIAICACLPTARCAEIVSTGRVGSLGDAYSVDRQSFVGSRCIISENPESIGLASSSLSLDQSMSQKQAENELGFSIGGRARYGLVEGTASANFLSKSLSNEYSIASIYSATYSFQTNKLAEPALTAVGRAVSGNPERWLNTCGSSYISEVKKGAKFYFSIKIDFRSKEEKQGFSAKFDVNGPAAGVNGSLQQASTEFSRRTKVTISVLQVGGDVDKISGIFGNAAAARMEYVECSLGTFEACAKVLQNALAYATNTETGFPSQLSDPTKRADLSYVVSDYAAAGIYEAPPPFFNQIIASKRARLANMFEKQYLFATRLASLRNVNTAPPRSTQLDAASKLVDENLRLIYNASATCYDTPKSCADVVDALQLATIGDDVFETPSFEALCSEAFGPNNSKKQDFVMALAYVDRRLSRGVWNIPLVDVCGGLDEKTNMTRFVSFSNIVDLSSANIFKYSSIQYSLEDISALQAGEETIEQLYLQNNSIIKIDTIGLLEKLGILDLSGNRVADISPLADVRRLGVLRLARNDIRDPAPLAGLSRLQVLDLTDNQIVDVSGLKNLPRLKILQLSNNQIEKIDGLLQLGSAMTLDLKNNRIKSLAGITSNGSATVDLSNNPVPPQEVLEFCEMNRQVRVFFTAMPGTYGKFQLTTLPGNDPNSLQEYSCNQP